MQGGCKPETKAFRHGQILNTAIPCPVQLEGIEDTLQGKCHEVVGLQSLVVEAQQGWEEARGQLHTLEDSVSSARLLRTQELQDQQALVCIKPLSLPRLGFQDKVAFIQSP